MYYTQDVFYILVHYLPPTEINIFFLSNSQNIVNEQNEIYFE